MFSSQGALDKIAAWDLKYVLLQNINLNDGNLYGRFSWYAAVCKNSSIPEFMQINKILQ